MATFTAGFLPLLAGGGGASLVTPDPGTLIWTWVTFGVLMLALRLFAWPGIAKSLAAREEKIAGDVARAEQARAEAEKLVVEHRQKLDTIRGEAAAIIAEGKADGEKLREKILSDAKTEGARLLAEAKRDVTLAKEAALAELRAATADLATQMAAKAVGRLLTSGDESRLREECLAELGAKR